MSNLTVFCGAHIATTQDAENLVRAIVSLKLQTRPTPLWLCEHHTEVVDNQHLVQDVRFQMPSNSRHIPSRSVKSVFEHYRVLIDKYVDASPTCLTTDVYSHWIAFIEYEDTVGPCRMESFAEGAEIHRCRWDVNVRQRQQWAEFRSVPVGFHMRDLVHLYNPRPAYSNIAKRTSHYWEHCVTARLLHFFLHHTGPAALHHPCAHIALAGLLNGPNSHSSRNGKLHRTVQIVPPVSMYNRNTPPFPPTLSRSLNWIGYTLLCNITLHHDTQGMICIVSTQSDTGGGKVQRADVEWIVNDILTGTWARLRWTSDVRLLWTIFCCTSLIDELDTE